MGNHIAVMVAGDGQNRGRVEGVRFVELAGVVRVFAVVVDDVTEVVEEAWRLVGRGIGQVRLHVLYDDLLRRTVLYPSGVTNTVHDEFARLLNPVNAVRAQDCAEVEVIGRGAAGRGE